MFRHCNSQLRFAVSAVALPSGAIRILHVANGLDFAAVIAFAEKMGAANLLFVELLPEIEAIVVRGFNRAGE